jgi:hypothetical protein
MVLCSWDIIGNIAEPTGVIGGIEYVAEVLAV